MTITSSQIQSTELKRFVSGRITPVSHKLVDGYLRSVYDTEDIKRELEKRIELRKDDGRYNRHLPSWKAQLKEIEEFEKRS